MRRKITNLLSALVIAGGGLYLSAGQVSATTGETEASCGSAKGECCKYAGGDCICGPCEKINPTPAPSLT